MVKCGYWEKGNPIPVKIFQTLQEKSSTTQILFQKQHNSLSKGNPRSDFVEGKTSDDIYSRWGIGAAAHRVPSGQIYPSNYKTNVGKSATYDR